MFLSDESLVVQGRAFVGFPLLVHRDGTAVEPAQSFLWDVLTTNGRAQSPLTWAKYGRDIYDYFAFLDANELDWQTVPSRGMPSVVDCGMTSKNACDLVLVTRVGLHPLFSACA